MTNKLLASLLAGLMPLTVAYADEAVKPATPAAEVVDVVADEDGADVVPDAEEGKPVSDAEKAKTEAMLDEQAKHTTKEDMQATNGSVEEAVEASTPAVVDVPKKPAERPKVSPELEKQLEEQQKNTTEDDKDFTNAGLEVENLKTEMNEKIQAIETSVQSKINDAIKVASKDFDGKITKAGEGITKDIATAKGEAITEAGNAADAKYVAKDTYNTDKAGLETAIEKAKTDAIAEAKTEAGKAKTEAITEAGKAADAKYVTIEKFNTDKDGLEKAIGKAKTDAIADAGNAADAKYVAQDKYNTDKAGLETAIEKAKTDAIANADAKFLTNKDFTTAKDGLEKAIGKAKTDAIAQAKTEAGKAADAKYVAQGTYNTDKTGLETAIAEAKAEAGKAKTEAIAEAGNAAEAKYVAKDTYKSDKTGLETAIAEAKAEAGKAKNEAITEAGNAADAKYVAKDTYKTDKAGLETAIEKAKTDAIADAVKDAKDYTDGQFKALDKTLEAQKEAVLKKAGEDLNAAKEDVVKQAKGLMNDAKDEAVKQASVKIDEASNKAEEKIRGVSEDLTAISDERKANIEALNKWLNPEAKKAEEPKKEGKVRTRRSAPAAAPAAAPAPTLADQLIAKYEGDMRAVNNRINVVEKDMQRGLAMQAALSGLVQPCGSCAGKFYFTAALGGYNSEQAVAIGSGYTFENKVTVKTGLATSVKSGGDFSYHVGAGFMF